jgi:hypothetical protein
MPRLSPRMPVWPTLSPASFLSHTACRHGVPPPSGKSAHSLAAPANHEKKGFIGRLLCNDRHGQESEITKAQLGASGAVSKRCLSLKTPNCPPKRSTSRHSGGRVLRGVPQTKPVSADAELRRGRGTTEKPGGRGGPRRRDPRNEGKTSTPGSGTRRRSRGSATRTPTPSSLT